MKMRSGTNLSLLKMKQEKLVVDFTFNTTNDSIEFTKATSVDKDLGLNTYRDIKNDQTQTAESLDIQDDSLEDTQKLNIFVKEEVTTKNRVLLDEVAGSEIGFDNYYNYYHCDICNQKMADLPSVLEHRESVHDIEYTGKSLKHIHLEPDMLDPKNRCQTCETKYLNRGRFRAHLKTIHFMKLTPLKDIPRKIIAPDPNDPNFYCRSCNKTYLTELAFRQHLKTTHKIKLRRIVNEAHRIKNPHLLPEWNDPNYYCKACEFTFKYKYSFFRHCKIKHHLKRPKNVRPDPNDPNFYCRVCNITLKKKGLYRSHCRYVHPASSKPAIVNPNEVPNITDPNHYCIACERKYSNKYYYRNHLYHVHKILNLPGMRKKPRDGIEPDVDDPNFFCCSCEKKLANKSSYQSHLLSIHSIGHLPQPEGILAPDPDNPNAFCRVCKRGYKNRGGYRNHLRKVHRMLLQPLTA